MDIEEKVAEETVKENIEEINVKEPKIKEPEVQTPPKAETQKTATKQGVNRWIYILLAFFFGLFGFHRFYAKHLIAGIFYLIFFAIGSILSLIGVGVFILWIEALVCVYDIIRALMADVDSEGKIHV